MSRATSLTQPPQSRAGSLPVNELPAAQSRRPASSSSAAPPLRSASASRKSISPLSKNEMFKQWGDEFRENSALSKHTPGFSIERQIQREQRAKGMCRISDRVFQSLSYEPKYTEQDKHERIIDLKRHTGRKFDQSAGFFTPAGAHLTYHPERSFKFLELHQHGNVAFGKLPAKASPADQQRAKYFEDAIMRRKFQWLHPKTAVGASQKEEDECPFPKLSREQKAKAAPPQAFFRSTRKTELSYKVAGSEVDGTCGSPEVVNAAINTRYCNRNKGHVMAGDCTREQRAKSGHYSGQEAPLSCKMAPLVVRYSGVGGKGFEKYVPIGEMPKTQISFGKAKKLQMERKDREAVERTSVQGNTEVYGNAVKAFDFTKRKLVRNISFGPGFKSKTASDDDY